jgi:hypothetical protein
MAEDVALGDAIRVTVAHGQKPVLSTLECASVEARENSDAMARCDS